jgi:hypothetical protein
MIPDRFVTEYPARCLELLDALEPIAHEREMLGTFSVLMAGSVLTIPLERLAKHHPIDSEYGSDLFQALRKLEKQQWLAADFWGGAPSGAWHFARVVTDPNDVAGWRNENDVHSVQEGANTIRSRKVSIVLRVLRNALAHGNIVYLNEHGHETAGTQLHSIGFLTRYEETPEQRDVGCTYRLVAVPEAEFLFFVKCWARWLASFAGEFELGEAA